MPRQPALDALRGLFLVMMTLTHLPLPLGRAVGQPLGFVSAAEGFVMLSATLLGLIYGARLQQQDALAVTRSLHRRAFKLYACQLALLAFAFFAVAPVGRELGVAAITNLFSYEGTHPLLAPALGIVLVHAPPLLDILPMYAVFVALSPRLLRYTRENGWRAVLCVSVALWLCAQLGLRTWLHHRFVSLTGIPFPFSAMGSFDVFGWQLVWVMGLFLGTSRANGRAATWTPDATLWWLCLTVAVYFFVWRHTTGIFPFGNTGSPLNALADKWCVGPLRLFNFLALLGLVWHWGPRFAPWMQRGPLVQLGRHALPVFCAQTVFSLVLLALVGDDQESLSWRAQAVIAGVLLVLLYGVARAAERRAARRPRGAVPAGG